MKVSSLQLVNFRAQRDLSTIEIRHHQRADRDQEFRKVFSPLVLPGGQPEGAALDTRSLLVDVPSMEGLGAFHCICQKACDL